MASYNPTPPQGAALNPLVIQHPYQPENDEKHKIRPGIDQVLELDVSDDVFAPGSRSWGNMRKAQFANLCAQMDDLIENFLATAEGAHVLSLKHGQLTNVRLMYIAILSPETYCKMKAQGITSPKQMADKNYSSHLLRLVATPRPYEDMSMNGKHTFANIQMAINTQADRIKLKEKQTKKRKSRDGGDGDEEDNESEFERWQRVGHLGVYQLSDVPVFLNPDSRNRGASKIYSYVHQASQASYFRLVNNYLHTRTIGHGQPQREIRESDHPANPKNAFSVMNNWLKRVAKLAQRDVYAVDNSKQQHIFQASLEVDDSRRNERRVRRHQPTKHLQPEIRFEEWFAQKPGEPLLASTGPNGEQEIRIDALDHLKTPYNGETCWLLDINDFNAATFRHRLFPWAVETASTGVSREKRAFVQNMADISSIMQFILPAGVSNAAALLTSGEAAVEKCVLKSEAELIKLYDHQVNMQPMLGQGITMRRWTAENMRREGEMTRRLEKEFPDEATHRSEVYLDRKRQLLVMHRLQCVDEFVAKMYTAEVTASKARRSLVKYFEDRRADAEEKKEPFIISCPRDRVHNNLSCLGDALVGEMEELDSLMFIHHGHDKIIMKLVGALQLHIPFEGPDGKRIAKLHEYSIDQSTQGGLGKSNSLEVFLMHLLPETYISTSKLTPQFLSGTDASPDEDGWTQKYHKMIIAQDEMQSDLFEPHTSSKGGSNNSSGGNGHSLAQIIKSVMTGGKYVNLFPLKSNDDTGIRKDGEIKVRCELMMYICTNRALTDYAQAGMSRCLIEYAKPFSRDEYPDRPSINVLMTNEANPNPVNRYRLKARFDKWRRNQFLASIVGQIIEGGVKDPIDMSCTDQIYNWVQEVAPMFNLSGFGAPRNMDHYRTRVQGLVLYEVFHKMFDIVGAPFASRPWTFQDVLWFTKHMVSTTEHATIAFGMTRSLFENEALMLTTRLLYEWACSLVDKHKHRSQPTADGTIVYQTNWKDLAVYDRKAVSNTSFYHQIEITSPSCFRADQSQRSEQLLEDLTKELTAFRALHQWGSSLTPDLILRTLQKLQETSLGVPVYQETSYGVEQLKKEPFVHRMQLKMDSKNIWIPCVKPTCAEENARAAQLKAELFKALSFVLNHPYASKRDLLYGMGRTSTPNLFEVISIREGSHKDGDRTLHITGDVSTPLLRDIDEHFISQFNQKINVGKYMHRAYPSNDPLTLMQQLYLFQIPYEIHPPYPTHDPLYFTEDYRARRKMDEYRSKELQQLQLVIREMRLRESQTPALLEEEEIQRGALERMVRLHDMNQELAELSTLRNGITPKMKAILGRKQTNPFAIAAQMWLRQPEHSQPIYPYLIPLANPTQLRNEYERASTKRRKAIPENPLPSCLEHPFTTLQISDKRATALLRYTSMYNLNVKTIQDVEQTGHLLTIDKVQYKVRKSVLLPATIRDEYDEIKERMSEQKENEEEEQGYMDHDESLEDAMLMSLH